MNQRLQYYEANVKGSIEYVTNRSTVCCIFGNNLYTVKFDLFYLKATKQLCNIFPLYEVTRELTKEDIENHKRNLLGGWIVLFDFWVGARERMGVAAVSGTSRNTPEFGGNQVHRFVEGRP